MFLAMLGVLGAMAGCGGDDGPAPARSFRMGPVDRTTEAEALTAAGRSITEPAARPTCRNSRS